MMKPAGDAYQGLLADRLADYGPLSRHFRRGAGPAALYRLYAEALHSASIFYARLATVAFRKLRRSAAMLDLVFLILGLAVFALFGGYAVFCNRL